MQSIDSGLNLLVSENDNVFLIAGRSGVSNKSTRLKHIADNLFKECRDEAYDSIFVVDARRPKHARKISGNRLQPWKGQPRHLWTESSMLCAIGMAISADGRFVACLSAGKTSCKVTAWSCYASHALLPSYHSLKLRQCVQAPQQVKKQIRPLLKQFGANLINYVHPCDGSLLFGAVDDVRDEVLDAALGYVARHNRKPRHPIKVRT